MYRIIVYAHRYHDGKQVQLLDNYYSDVSILNMPPSEDMEKAFPQHLLPGAAKKNGITICIHYSQMLTKLRYKSRLVGTNLMDGANMAAYFCSIII